MTRQRQAEQRTSSTVAVNTSASAAEWLVTKVASGNTIPNPATQQAIPRWNRPASECGQGSTSRLISRPCSEVVHSAFTGQLLHTTGRAR